MNEVFEGEVEDFLEDRFFSNLSILETEESLRLNAFVKEQALWQIKMYWKKMKEMAMKVTQAEVPVTLSNLKTPRGRTYNISGVVDIVQEGDKTVLYDIKTHDPKAIQNNKEKYQRQLNIYGSVWENSHQKKLDHTAVIATPLPKKLTWALRENNLESINLCLSDWKPVYEFDYCEEQRDETLEEFGKVVDCIEDGEFSPQPVSVLKEPYQGSKEIFAVRVCRNCDIRFACESYLEYSFDGRRPGDDLLKIIKDMGNSSEAEMFKEVSAAADFEKNFEASAEEIFGEEEGEE
jgi:hypothetical protein